MAKQKQDKSDDSSLFMPVVSKATLAINKSAAGAGVLGLVGFAALFLVACVFFVTENYFVAMLIMSFALLVYVTGSELAKLFLTSFTIFFSSKHVIPAAAHLQETLVPLRRTLMAMTGRPVNIQASRDVVLHFRGDLLGQPYLLLFEKPDHLSLTDKPLS